MTPQAGRPDLAAIAMWSGLPVELVGWHLSRGTAVLSEADVAAARSLRSAVADFAIDCNRTAAAACLLRTGEARISLPDPTARAVALDPAVDTAATSHPVRVEYHGDLTRGQTAVDQLGVGDDPQNAVAWFDAGPDAWVVWSIDGPAFKRMLSATLAG